MTLPSYEQLAALVAAQDRVIAQLRARIVEQDAEIAELKRRLAASSRNSSKPPSSDGFDKPAPKSLRGGPVASPAASRGGRAAPCDRLPSPTRWSSTSRAAVPAAAAR